MADRFKRVAPVLVIGLGRFGAAAAGHLGRLGREVLAVDDSEALVQKWSERVTHAVQADANSIDALRQIGAQEFSIAVCSVASAVESSVLIAANLVDPADLGKGYPQVPRYNPRAHRREPRRLLRG